MARTSAAALECHRASYPPPHSSVPSDFLGKDFQFDQSLIDAIVNECSITENKFKSLLYEFKIKYNSQSLFEHNPTDLSVFFADYLFNSKDNGYSPQDYFDFEFYNKPIAERNTFFGNTHMLRVNAVLNNFNSAPYVDNKALFNQTYSEYVRRDWLDMTRASFDDFKLFVSKHPSFFVKLINGHGGQGAHVISIDETSDLKALYNAGRNRRLVYEEIVSQHSDIAAFCPNTVNTLRITSVLDKHGTVRIMSAAGRFGRVGGLVDNFHGGGCSVIVDPLTGVITSDAINAAHERLERHPDTDKVFRGFQYPSWDVVRRAVLKSAKIIPSLRYIGWDIAIKTDGKPEFIEGNKFAGADVQQAPDLIGRKHLYQPLFDEQRQYNLENMRALGYKVNRLNNFDEAYQMIESNRRNRRVPFALENLIDGCQSLLDVGCRRNQYAKRVCPSGVEYYPADFDCNNKGTIECDFNAGQFPDLEVDTVMSIYTAEFVEMLPEFLRNMCRAARRQVLMVCRPIDKESKLFYRWKHPFAVDFTEQFLIESVEKEGFRLSNLRSHPDNRSIILYDFRR